MPRSETISCLDIISLTSCPFPNLNADYSCLILCVYTICRLSTFWRNQEIQGYCKHMNFHSHRRLAYSTGPFSEFERCLWKGQLFKLPSLHPRKWLNLYRPYHLKVTRDVYHDLNPMAFISSRANTLGAYRLRCCYSWKKRKTVWSTSFPDKNHTKHSGRRG